MAAQTTRDQFRPFSEGTGTRNSFSSASFFFPARPGSVIPHCRLAMSMRFLRDLLALAVLAAAYFGAGKLGLKLAFVNASATAVWPCTGIALAAFLIRGYRAWPAILAGAFLVNLTTAGSAATSLGIAVGNTLEGVVGWYLVSRFAGSHRAFERAQDVLKFAFLAGMVSTTVSATVGVTTLALAGF